MKKPNIESLREKKFTKAVSKLKHKPNAETITAIDSKTFSLGGNSVFRYKPEVLALREYESCLELLERRIPQAYSASTPTAVMNVRMLIMPIMRNISTREMKHTEELEKIAVDTVRDIFNIPEHININPEIQSGMSGVNEQDNSPEKILSLSTERQTEIEEQIQKRIILNGIVHGCAMHIWKSAHYIIKEKIDAIDPRLMELYNIYTTSMSWSLWQVSPSMAMASIKNEGVTQGKNELKFEDDGCDIDAEGINFPVLLHEISKGAVDYLISHGIPEDFTEEELVYYYAKADNHQDEFWHYLLSPSLWTSLIEAADVNSQELPEVIMGLAKLDLDKLSLAMKGCIDGPEEGRKKLKEFKIL